MMEEGLEVIASGEETSAQRCQRRRDRADTWGYLTLGAVSTVLISSGYEGTTIFGAGMATAGFGMYLYRGVTRRLNEEDSAREGRCNA